VTANREMGACIAPEADDHVSVNTDGLWSWLGCS